VPPTPETEPNDTPATANPLPLNGWVSGARDPALAAEQDWYSFSANAGDTVSLSLDLDPERDNVQWNGRLGIALFGDAGNLILVVDDASAGSLTNPLSEAFFMTAKTAGTYFAFVDSASAATGGPTATYTLSVSIHPPADQGVNCTTYTSTDVPKTIGPGAGLVSSTITVPGNPRIADLDVQIQLDHLLMADVDAHLRSPAGNDNGLFTDVGSAAVGGQTQMDAVFDDEAGLTPAFTALKNLGLKPELSYRLAWLDGEDAGGTWTLDLRDDGANASGGTLTAWSLRICEAPPPPACAPGFTTQTVFSTDFEAGAAGFTHSGTADEWELGLPATVATTTANPVADFSTCNSGVSCWKTDLDNTYNVSSTQDLLSPNIDLAGLTAPVVVTWAQRYQIESASFDHAFVDYQQAGGATPVRLFEWLDATMTNAPGNPVVNIGASSGWSLLSRRADSLAGLDTELRFHLDSDTTINFAGLAIDDVSVTACRPLSANLSITKTDGVTDATPGGQVTYTITASNAGTDAANPATVSDTFPAALSCTWNCVGGGGGTCTAAGVGDINDSAVNLPSGGSVTYTAVCDVSASATGSLVNTATVASGVNDPDTNDNSATDTDTLTPSSDASATIADAGADPVSVHQAFGYSGSVTNSGPSDAASVQADFLLTTATGTASTGAAGWSCVGLSCSGPLDAGQTANFTINVNAVTTPGTVTGDATATASGDPNGANDTDSETTTVRFQKGDLDSELNTDLFLRNTAGNDNLVWSMNGITRSSFAPTVPAAPASPTSGVVGVDDFDSDFRNDLVFWDPATGVVEFWFMNGVNRTGVQTGVTGAPTLATNWKLSATGDFNHDGQPDIVWRNFTSQKIVIWTMNGATKIGNISPTPDQAVDFNWEIVAALDYNGDGERDFLWYNFSSGKIVTWYMNASVVRITGQFTVPPNAGDANWKVQAGGDYGVGPGGLGGTNDIVWRNATSGKFVVWYMDNASVRTAGSFTSPDSHTPNPTDWLIVGPR
jgi:uncharacterized repeat protein (TIGR01451 family)